MNEEIKAAWVKTQEGMVQLRGRPEAVLAHESFVRKSIDMQREVARKMHMAHMNDELQRQLFYAPGRHRKHGFVWWSVLAFLLVMTAATTLLLATGWGFFGLMTGAVVILAAALLRRGS